MENLKEACGVFGVCGTSDAPRLTMYGLMALQHRGQESAGIAVGNGREIAHHKGMGLVEEVLDERRMAALRGSVACGHVRYSTSGGSVVANAQPLVVRYRGGGMALAHNGNLVNAASLRHRLQEDGAIFQTSIDSEVIAALIARSNRDDLAGAIRFAMGEVRGAYSLVISTADRLVGVRDPLGMRPLVLGRRGDAWVLASESCALAAVGAVLVRDLAPGEIAVADGRGLSSFPAGSARQARFCLFEYIYFGRADSVMEGKLVHATRARAGEMLFREHPASADVVVPVPDSGLSAAAGYSAASGIPIVEGLARNRFVGRTFLQPEPAGREMGVDIKLSVLEDLVRGRSVVLVDDSIVRGTTTFRVVAKLRASGAAGVHLRIASPPVVWPCHFGIDTPSREELIAAAGGVEDLRRRVGADSLAYLSLAGIEEAVGGGGHCNACFSGDYPFDVMEQCHP